MTAETLQLNGYVDILERACGFAEQHSLSPNRSVNYDLCIISDGLFLLVRSVCPVLFARNARCAVRNVITAAPLRADSRRMVGGLVAASLVFVRLSKWALRFRVGGACVYCQQTTRYTLWWWRAHAKQQDALAERGGGQSLDIIFAKQLV